MAITIVSIGAVARHLGPDTFGHLNAILAVLAIAAPWANLSLEAVVVRELVQHPERAGAILGTACTLRALAGLTAIGGVALGGWWVLPDQWSLLVLASTSLVFQSAAVVDLWFQRHLASRRSVISHTIVIYVGAITKLLLVAAGAPLPAFVGVIVFEAVLYALGFVIAYRRSPERTPPWQWDGPLARRLLRASTPLALAGLVAGLGGRFDQMLVAINLSDHTAGLYLAANRFSEFALYAGGAVMTSLFPGLAAARHAPEAFQTVLRQLFEVMSALGWAFAIGFTLFAPLLIRIVLGDDYAGSVPALIARGWIGLLLMSASVRAHAMLLTVSTWWNLTAALVSVAVQLALASWCLTHWGMLGAASAMGAGALIGGVVLTWIVPALRPLAAAQLGGLLIIVRPGRWRALLGSLTK